MKIEELKHEWQNVVTPQLDIDRLRNMTLEKSHPVLSGIRKQLILELFGWSAFVIICFTGLDADQKPFLTSVILIIVLALAMLFNVYGYQLSKDLIAGPDINSSLQNRIASLRRFAFISVVLRLVLIAGVGYFLSSSLQLDLRRLMLLGVASVVLVVPLYLLIRLWSKRISRLSETLRLLEEH